MIAATSQTPMLKEILRQQQATDPVIQHLYMALSHSNDKLAPPKGSKWHQSPLSRYRQLWPQLLLSNGIVCCQYAPTPSLPAVIVPIIPSSQRLTIL